jgi:hypothetical protein
MYQGMRYRMTVNEFAVPRMDVGKQRPIQSMEEARDWERLFIGEIKAGRDLRRPRTPRKPTDVAPKDVAGFLDAYVERCAKPAGLKSEKALCSRVAVLKRYLGDLPLDSLEDPDDINRFKISSDYAEDVELATLNRTLETLRAAMNWGLAQTPPFFKKSPFHRYGVWMNKKAETMRDRRLLRDEDPQARSSDQGRRLRAVDQRRALISRGEESRTANPSERSGDARAPAPAHGRRLSPEGWQPLSGAGERGEPHRRGRGYSSTRRGHRARARRRDPENHAEGRPGGNAERGQRQQEVAKYRRPHGPNKAGCGGGI